MEDRLLSWSGRERVVGKNNSNNEHFCSWQHTVQKVAAAKQPHCTPTSAKRIKNQAKNKPIHDYGTMNMSLVKD